ncbi:MAG: hypothetical protein IPK27_11105 [Rhodanobacteraceae bacterium]|nr:hypothetical protein [Rhodanobacteraceae bacterium]
MYLPQNFGLRTARRLAAGLLAASGAALAGGPLPVMTVGSGPACNHASLAAALAAAGSAVEIRIAAAELNLGAAAVISDRQVRIVGGYTSCDAVQPADTSVLRGTAPGAPVLSIDDNILGEFAVELVNLRITGGSNAAGGGGIRTVGAGTLVLSNTHVYGNQALDGGGVYVDGDGADATSVELRGDSRIGEPGGGNLATRHGGGLFCTQAVLRLGHVRIGDNVAAEGGGGLRLVDCDVLPLDEPGDTTVAANRARDGGGIYAMGGSALLLASTATRQVAIRDNQAIEGASPQRGGGVYLTGAGTRMVGAGLWIQGNRAVLGGGGLFLTAGATASLGRAPGICALGDSGCSRLDDNRAAQLNGSFGDGGGALVLGGSQLLLAHTRIRGNQAGNNAVLRVNGAGSMASLDNVLVSGNQSAGRLLSLEADATVDADFVTLADNQFDTAAIQTAAGTALALQRSILQVGAGQGTVAGAGTVTAACINSNDAALGGDTHDPGFADAANGNYRLRTSSQNLDRCAADGNEALIDLGGLPRNRDRAEIPDNIGPLDRGAYEDADELLRTGFES